MQELLDSIKKLNDKFDDKIAIDKHKEKLFDNMHKELVSYQHGIIEKLVEVMALDLIQVYDNLSKILYKYSETKNTEEDYYNLLRNMEFIKQDIEDVLYRQSIERFDTEGEEVNTKTQKIIQVINTEDETLHNKIAEKTSCGFRKEDKVLRPENIKIYKYKKQ